MSRANDIPLDTRVRQNNASDPARSVWVSANAGSGKTHVLVQRVLRLLLRGVPPARILCLTFTKAAAANMALRVFDTLAEWTRLDDRDLSTAIIETGTPEPKQAALTFARRLFARTVETPGGLKIQTIHAFCERLLHVFPFEANVPARFEVLEDLRQSMLLEQARIDVLTEAAQDKGLLGAHLERLVSETSGAGFNDIVREAIRHGAMFRKLSSDEHEKRLRHILRLGPNDTTASLTREMIEDGIDPTLWGGIAAFLGQGAKTDQGRAGLFQQAWTARNAQQTEACLDAYLQIFFTEKGQGTPAKKLLTAALAKARPDLAAELDQEQQRLEQLRDKVRSLAILERTGSLLALTREVFTRYEHFKAARGWLDFGDLIDKTLTLFTRSSARWVLYKLDRGIDHILVDEAQDTSEAQWKILEELMGDFAAGAGAASPGRTFFAVGDDKQSIFSFQGAAPHMFHAMRRKVEKKFVAGDEPFSHVELNLSFRSVPAILNAVDKIFDRAEHKKGVVDDIWILHDALKHDLPGRIEFWPRAGTAQREDPSDWSLPLDTLDQQDPASIMANRVATKIAALLAPGSGEHVYDTKTKQPRAAGPSDILILVRTRGPFFEAIIRALKQSNVPVAGADRLELTAHIAVMDLMAAGHAALLPQDDLTLATVLKSPLIGLDDDDLLMIAPLRSGSLFEALGQSPVEKHQRAFAKIARWRERARYELPFAFYMRLLSEDGGRHDMEARLGPEACDAMDEFLRLALLHDQEPAPSLSLFLADLDHIDLAIKRDMETGAEAVRVMTVHAAKGLEAKIVFLPDTCGTPSANHDSKLFALRDEGGAEILAWSPRKAEDCAGIASARQSARDASDEEYRRLLYVALTRAEERLYISGFHGAREPQPGCWYKMIEATLQDELEPVPAFWSAEDTILQRVSPGTRAPAPPAAFIAKPLIIPDTPDWLRLQAPRETGPRPPLRPSTGLAAADAFDIKPVSPVQREAMRRGQLTHVLLQYLPAVSVERRFEMGQRFLGTRAPDWTDAQKEMLIRDVLAVIDAPELTRLFAPGSKAEVPIAGRITGANGAPIDVIGQVDRIAEDDANVFIADFKTGEPHEAEATPPAYLTQMALYRAALAPLWPRKHLQMMLIWTYGPKIVILGDALLDQAIGLI